ncbi:MAG: hypothetical protein ACR2LM_00610 [Pyrinomonadaceae bacterium]
MKFVAPFVWSRPESLSDGERMISIALVEPEIPPNTETLRGCVLRCECRFTSWAPPDFDSTTALFGEQV